MKRIKRAVAHAMAFGIAIAAVGNGSQAAAPDIPGNTTTTATLQAAQSVISDFYQHSDSDWFAIDLEANQAMRINVSPSGALPADRISLSLYSATGHPIAYAYNGTSPNQTLPLAASIAGRYYIGVSGRMGEYTLAAATGPGKPAYTHQQIAYYLTDGWWADCKISRPAPRSGRLTYSIAPDSKPEAEARMLAALGAWAAVSTNTVVRADEGQQGNFINLLPSNQAWTSQVWLHELGHAWGFGHAGNYSAGSASKCANRIGGWSPFVGEGRNDYLQDNLHATVMSYFPEMHAASSPLYGSQDRRVGPTVADILAIQTLYGVPTDKRLGDTVYGFGSNADVAAYDFSKYIEGTANNPGSATMVSFAIFDSGGNDTLNASGFTANQTIDLHAGAYSSIGREIGNIGIAVNTVIENARGGSGNDVLIGNDVANVLEGSAGHDTLDGEGSADQLTGGLGNDRFLFAPNDGADTVADFQDGLDKIVLFNFGLSGFSQLQGKISNVNGNARIDLSERGSSIVLTGVNAASLDASDFVFD
jgi:serralysin